MGVPGYYFMTPGTCGCKNDRVGNPAFESLVPEFSGKDCNIFRDRDNKAPDTDLRDNLTDSVRGLIFLVKEFYDLSEGNCGREEIEAVIFDVLVHPGVFTEILFDPDPGINDESDENRPPRG